MSKVLLHTPEGVRDIYGDEFAKKIVVTNKIHDVFRKYGFRDIQTPTFEFFDIFNKEKGSVASKNMYKFFDREGYTLVLRPDITPSIARCAAKYYTNTDSPIRFCYTGNTYINNSEYQGKLKESTQEGCELIGDNSSDADAEMVAVIVESLLASGLKEFQISLGEAGFIKGLVEDCGLDEETEDLLRTMITNKNNFGMEDVLDEKQVSDENKKVFMKLPELFGQADVLDTAASLTNIKKSLKAIERLKKVYEILKIYGLEKYVSFDLGMVSNYKYYTGIIFRAYTYGTGDAIVMGGRYDGLIKQFGKDAPSIGFGINVDQLIAALSSQKILIETDYNNIVILFRHFNRKVAFDLATNFRNAGINVELTRKSGKINEEIYLEAAKNNNVKKVYYIENANEVRVMDLENNTSEIKKVSELYK